MDKFEYAAAKVNIWPYDVIPGVQEYRALLIINNGEKFGSGIVNVELDCDIVIDRSGRHVLANSPLAEMTPYLSKLGDEGWEVVTYKFSTSYPSFGEALLKRKVQKQE